MYDENQDVKEFRDRLERIEKLHKKLRDDVANIKLLYAENFVSLLNHKRSLYDGTNSIFIATCNEAADYISKVASKEIRKNAKSPLKDSYQALSAFIENIYGIKVKEITSIVTVGYDWQKEIEFIDAKHGALLRLVVPVVRSAYYKQNVGFVMPMDDEKLDDMLSRLSTRLYFVKEKTDCFISLDEICAFPNATYNLEDFGRFLDRYFEKGE